MKSAGTLFIILVFLVASANLIASGPVGLFAVLEKVVFEPDEQSAERIRVWGAFAFVDGGIQAGQAVAAPQRGYVYFTMPPSATQTQAQVIKKEWADLKAIAGTGQAIAFGNWGYIGSFSVTGENEVYVTVQTGERSFRGIALRVLDVSEPAGAPAPYVTNTGVVKLAADGNHAAIVKRLKESLKR